MLSASSINDYINCPLKFYFGRVMGLKEADEMSETMESSTFGNIYHQVMQQIYDEHKNKLVTEDLLTEVMKNTYKIDTFITQAFAKHYFKRPNDKVELTGYSLLVARIVRSYVMKTLAFDKECVPFTYLESEKNISKQLALSNGQKVNVKVLIDRIDERKGVVHIVDYKTGGMLLQKMNFPNMEALFTPSPNHPKEAMQTLFYSLVYSGETKKPICPTIYAIRLLNQGTELSCKKEPIRDFSKVADNYKENLVGCLDELFDFSEPFTQVENVECCRYCPFIKICQR